MKNTFGNNISVTLFGESHGPAIGAVVDGLPAGIKLDYGYIAEKLSLRRPSGENSTPRQEPDNYKILSGVFNDFTTGAPLSAVIENENTKSKDYSKLENIARPSHADYTAFVKFGGFADYRGGGHFSGRITAPLVLVGSILQKALEDKGIYIGTHIKSIAEINDDEFGDLLNDITALSDKTFPVLNEEKGILMNEKILQAKENKDSLGGILQTAVIGMPQGVGEPWFDTVEGTLAHALFSVPAVKGVEFGLGFGFGAANGSSVNDEFEIKDGKIVTKTNNNGGINGGITNGMPIIFNCAVKPTPSIGLAQNSVDMKTKTETKLEISGRHDPCIVHRARAVIDSVTAIVLADLLSTKFGIDWLVK